MVALPPYCRLFQLAVIRCAKLLGADQLQLNLQDLGQHWPRSSLRWFPPNVLQAIAPGENELAQLEQLQAAKHAQAMVELHNISQQEMQRLLQIDAEYFGASFGS